MNGRFLSEKTLTGSRFGVHNPPRNQTIERSEMIMTQQLKSELLSSASATEEAEAFLEHVCGLLDAGAQTVMLSIGHRAGLFDVLSDMPPSTSHEIAEKAGLAERYVREWLAVMVTGGLVDYYPETGTYHLPTGHAACLTRGASLGNMAVYAQMVALMGASHDRVLDCFRTGEGTRYGDYPCFHTVMAEDSAQTVVAPLFDSILPLVDGLDTRLREGIDVLDAGCGRGLALLAMAEAFPRSRFTGYDLCRDAIDFASSQARERQLSNIHFEVVDLTGFEQVDSYDLVTSFDAVHDQKDPAAVLVRLYRSIKPGGVHLMQDIGGSAHLENNRDFPLASLLYAISCMHCMPVSIGQGGEGLGTMWGWETAEAMLRRSGFVTVERHLLAHDPMNVWFVSRKAPGVLVGRD
jgi:2-polyprenyl-3-methyl-5-hydroxy-6-metoxy-1,4-benzoquinol methylase